MPVPLGHWGKNRADEGRFGEKGQDKKYRDALGVRVSSSNGRISPGDGWDTRGRYFQKVSI